MCPGCDLRGRGIMNPEVRSELQGLLSALCDGELTAVQQARLEELLEADADCRRLYLEYVDMQSRLLGHPLLCGNTLPRAEEGPGSPSGSPPLQTPTLLPSQAPPPGRLLRRWRSPQIFRYMGVASATLAASLLLQLLWWH